MKNRSRGRNGARARARIAHPPRPRGGTPHTPAAWSVAALAPCVLVAALPARAAAQDLRYSVTPTAEQVSWDNALGLDNTLLYGGRLGVVFGRRIELQGHYLTNQGADNGVGDLYDRLGATNPPQNPGLGVRNYGAALVYNFSVGGFTPFLRGGGSVLRFVPEGGRRSDRVAFSYGGGLRFGKPGGLRFNVFAEDLRFRIDRTLLLALPAGATPPVADADATKLRSNLTYGAGLSIPLGGGAATYDDTPQYQLGNVALPVDVFAGQQNFSGASGLPRQNIVGLRTGIDFGPLVGLRGFYWRGVNDNFSRQQGVQAYGGEAQFSLNAGPGVNPFLIAGAAQVDFLNTYDRVTAAGAPIAPPADQTALILGGGVKIPVGTRFVLTGAARNYLGAVGGRTQDVAEASQLRSNWQYSVGLSLGIGGRGARRRTAARQRSDTVFVDRESGRRLSAAEVRDSAGREVVVREAAGGEVERSVARETVVERFVVTTRGDTLRGAAGDSALATDRRARLVEVRQADARTLAAPGAGGAGYASGRTVQVPVPTEGEIIVRYGPQRVQAGAAPAAAAPGQAFVVPPRTFQREYRERDGRVVREYRESDGTLSREFRDQRNRTIREYRDPSGRVIREYVTVSSAGAAPVIVAPPSGGQYAPQAAPQYAPAYAPPPATPAPRYVPGYEPQGYTPPADPGRPSEAPIVFKEAPGATEGATSSAQPRRSREPAFEARVSARIDSLERAVAVRDAAAAAAGAPAPAERVSADEVRAIVREELARGDRARAVVVTPGAATQTTEVRTVQRREYYGTGVQGGLLYSGATVTGGAQLLTGARLDFGALAPAVPGFRLVPELAFGFGAGGTSTYVAANALYEIGPILRLRPRVSFGAGLLNFSSPVAGRDGLDLVLTPAYGASLPFRALGRFGGRVPELVVEHQGVGVFDVNRLIVGLGWRR